MRDYSNDTVAKDSEGRPITCGDVDRAFNLVTAGSHWKDEIDVQVRWAKIADSRDRAIAIIEHAVPFYTATNAVVLKVGPATLHVEAPGYWAGPAC